MEGEEEEKKPALVVSSGSPKFWSHLLADVRKNKRHGRRHQFNPHTIGKLCLEEPLGVPCDPNLKKQISVPAKRGLEIRNGEPERAETQYKRTGPRKAAERKTKLSRDN